MQHNVVVRLPESEEPSGYPVTRSYLALRFYLQQRLFLQEDKSDTTDVFRRRRSGSGSLAETPAKLRTKKHVQRNNF